MKMKNIWLMALMGLLFISCQGSMSNSPSNCAPASPLSPSSLVKFLTTGETNKKAMLVATSKGQVRTFPLNLVEGTIADTKLDLPGGLWNFQLFLYSEYDGKEIPTAYVAFGEQNTSGCFADLKFTRDDFLFDEPSPSEPNPFLTPNISLTEGCEKKFDCDGDGVPNYWEIVGRSNPFSADSVPPKGPIIDLISPAPNETALGITLIQAEAYSVGHGVKDLTLVLPENLSDEDGRAESVKSRWDTRTIQYQKVNLKLVALDDEGNKSELNRDILVANGFLKSFNTLNGQDPKTDIVLSWETQHSNSPTRYEIKMYEGSSCSEAQLIQTIPLIQGVGSRALIPANSLEKFKDYAYALSLTNEGQTSRYCQSFATGDTDLVAWWRFDGDNVNTIKDWSSSGNDGEGFGMDGQLPFVSGVEGSALSLDGIDDYVSTQTHNLPQKDQDGSLEVWIKFSNLLEEGATIYSTSSGGNNGNGVTISYLLGVGSNFDFFSVIDGQGGIVSENDLEDPLNTWYHLVWTRNSNGHWEFYVNGKLRGSYDMFAGPWQDTGSTIGHLIGRQDNFLKAILDEFKIYKRVLTSEEINASCRKYSPEICGDVVPLN